MARDTQSIVKMSRREGYALHPKAHKALVKRAHKPGQGQQGRGRRGGKASQYSLQLREKQKVKRLYGLLETPIQQSYERSSHASKANPAKYCCSSWNSAPTTRLSCWISLLHDELPANW